MCVCVCVCTRARAHVHMHVRVCVCVRACVCEGCMSMFTYIFRGTGVSMDNKHVHAAVRHEQQAIAC